MATNACAVLQILVAARTTFVQHRSVLNQSAVFNVCLQPRIFAHLFAVLVFLEGTSGKDLLSAICWQVAASTASQTFFRFARAHTSPFGAGGQASSEARVASSECAALGGGGVCRTPSGRYGSSGPRSSGAMPLGRIRARCLGWYPTIVSCPPSILERATMSGVTAGSSPGQWVSEKSFGKFEIEL